jgi:hypothetical protein
MIRKLHLLQISLATEHPAIVEAALAAGLDVFHRDSTVGFGRESSFVERTWFVACAESTFDSLVEWGQP